MIVKCQSLDYHMTRTKVQEYNWNYLDQHVCGYSDFEILGEVSPARVSTCLR